MEKVFQPRMFAATLLMGMLLLPCDLLAQNSNKQVWWLKTDKGQYVDMSRVKMFTNVDKKETFEIIVHEGDGVIGVESVIFEKNSPVSVKGDANGDGFIDKEDVTEVVNDIISNQYSETSDINKDGKVNVVDMVALVNIVNVPKAGARGLLTTFGQRLSISDDIPGTIIPDDDSGTTGSDDVQDPRDPEPGTIIPEDDPGTTDPDDVQDPRDPEPGTIISEDDPGTTDPDDVQDPRDPDPGTIDPQDDPEPRDPQDDPEDPRDPQPDPEEQYEIWPIELLPGTIVNQPDNRVVPTPQEVINEPITIEPEPVRIIPQQVEQPTNLGSVPYFRVQFTENLLEVKKYAGGSSSDNFTFFNPAYDYLDFKYPLPFTDSNISGDPASDYFYYIGNTPKDRTRFAVAKTDGSLAIKKIWVHNQPVQFINVSSDELSDVIDGQRTITYTFNALPRNMEELKTLEVNDREYFKSPHFVTALFICCLNRITDNSSDAWHMINYLRTHTATVGENNIFKVSNVAMQGIAQRLMEKDPNGFPVSNGLRSYFAGSSPDNQYTPTEPYQVTVVEKVSNVYTTEDGFLCAKLYVKSSGSKNLIGPLKLRKVEGHDWMVYSGEEVFTKQMDPQK